MGQRVAIRLFFSHTPPCVCYKTRLPAFAPVPLKITSYGSWLFCKMSGIYSAKFICRNGTFRFVASCLQPVVYCRLFQAHLQMLKKDPWQHRSVCQGSFERMPKNSGEQCCEKGLILLALQSHQWCTIFWRPHREDPYVAKAHLEKTGKAGKQNEIWVECFTR